MSSAAAAQIVAGRYMVLAPFAWGGMAVVHLGRVLGPAGFSKVVAIKRMHSHLAREPNFVAMFLDEARLAARVRHTNVASTLDVVEENGELFVIMEYVLGENVSHLLRVARRPPSPDVAAAIIVGVLHGLHAAHEAVDDDGAPLGIVHRDVSPQNIIVGADGSPRIVDFGVATAVGRVQITHTGELKGKASYMPPEQARSKPLDRRADIYAAAVVLWELLTCRRMFAGNDPVAVMLRVCEEQPPAASTFASSVKPELDAVLARALAKSRDDRFDTAQDFADAIESAITVASPRVVAAWVKSVASGPLAQRARAVELATQFDAPAPAVTPAIGPPSADEPRSAPAQVDEAGRMRRRIGAVVGMFAVGVAVAFFSAQQLEDAQTPIAPATAVSPEPTPATTTTPTAIEPVASATETVDLDMSVPTHSRLDAGTARRVTKPAPAPTPAAQCNPPWTIAADGIKVLKRECR